MSQHCKLDSHHFSRTYTEVILKTDGSPDALTEEELEAIFDEFGHSYHSETNAKCFNVETIFEAEVADHEAGATGEELLHMSPLMISYLLQGYCIGEASETDPQEFLENIFEKYGHDGTIPEEDFEAMLTSLSIGGAVEDSHGHEEDAHNHAKRSLKSHGNIDSITKREVVDDHGHGSSNGSKVMDVSSTCFTGEDLLTIHGVDHEIGITEEQFVHLCPSLLQQILSESCNEAHEDEPKEISPLVWLYGSVAVFIISLGAVLGGLLLPCLPARFFEKFIHSLIALAIAILAGDALIHLLPLAIGIHGHESGSHVCIPLDEELAFAWKSLATLSAIYAFYLLETIMDGGLIRNMLIQEYAYDQRRRHRSRKSTSQKELTKHTDSESVDFSSESGGCLTKYGALPVMVIIGDGLHNFGDGLAIGAAFTASVGAGISTSVAVLCHEIPHELGDLAILLKSGLKLKTALCLNFMSALTSFAGLYLGIALATTEIARQWIFAVTAGMFLYVALADMMPQITHIKNVKDPLTTFILQNIFFLAGAVFIFVIAIYEDAINFSF
ncbi:putative zinc transporter ZIP12 [Apostichopus japonicus]|uniref:Putative zinc transporter ZIP12 n=1 Tax=Stichopus japonicus TaxID=307972 RepID=A0A2G8LJ35_STIJA|nr:putative zinc transporter ZIP12 [Apostichopus japonicus]